MATDTHFSRILSCPHCGLALHTHDRGATCDNQHSFDRAREGYFNLIVGGRLSPSVVAGDTAEALAARRRFLSSGGYSLVADALRETVLATLAIADGPILDVGCGEGYYLSQIKTSEAHGLDVSKKAVQMASRLLPDATFVVGSAFRLPILDSSCAAVFSVFAPHSFHEFARILKPGARWTTVTPGPHHLQEMRPIHAGKAASKALEREHRRREPPAESDSAERISYSLVLSAESAHDLFTMTPLQWQKNAADNIAGLREVSIDMWVSSGSRDNRA